MSHQLAQFFFLLLLHFGIAFPGHAHLAEKVFSGEYRFVSGDQDCHAKSVGYRFVFIHYNSHTDQLEVFYMTRPRQRPKLKVSVPLTSGENLENPLKLFWQTQVNFVEKNNRLALYLLRVELKSEQYSIFAETNRLELKKDGTLEGNYTLHLLSGENKNFRCLYHRERSSLEMPKNILQGAENWFEMPSDLPGNRMF